MPDEAFTVDPHVLHGLARNLIMLSAKLDEARVTTLQVNSSGFGQPKLCDAADHFVQHWTWQAQRIGSALQDTGNRLSDAAHQYQRLEDAQLAAENGTVTA